MGSWSWNVSHNFAKSWWENIYAENGYFAQKFSSYYEPSKYASTCQMDDSIKFEFFVETSMQKNNERKNIFKKWK